MGSNLAGAVGGRALPWGGGELPPAGDPAPGDPGETAFGGELPATRAMAVTMLWRMAGRPEVLGPSGFSDVEPDSWYTPSAVWAETRGVLLGYGDGTVRPQEKVTREQLQKMLERCLGRGQVEVFRAVAQPEGGGEGMTRGELTQILMELWEGER